MILKKKIIYGCEARGDAEPYLIRYTLIENKNFQICLHIFLRSDHVDLHDHPWDFVSLVLWRGYYEETLGRCTICGQNNCAFAPRQRKRFYPGSLLIRKAQHKHRVVLANNKRAVTLVIMGKRKRDWGFITESGWLQWFKYFTLNKCK